MYVVSTLHAIISASVAKQRDIGRADQIRHRVLGGRQTETCPLPPCGTSTGVSPAAIHKRTGHPGAISTVVVTNSPPSDYKWQLFFLYNGQVARRGLSNTT